MSNTDLVHDRTRLASGDLQQVSPLVRRLIAPNPSPFTFTGTCTYIVGRGKVAVVDPGPESEDQLAAILGAVDGETVSHIVVTHTHRDHSPGARALKAATGAQIYGCARHIPIENDASGRLDASHDLDHVPDHEMHDGDRLQGADFSLVAVHTPGHASNHLCFALPQENALLSGDHVMAWSTTIVAPPDGVMRDYMESLDKLRARDDAIYWPGHGGPVLEPQRYVRALAHHRRQREVSILNRLAAGDSDIASIVETIYEGLDPRLKPAAALSVLAHMEDMVNRGIAACDGPATLVANYRKP
ncbi:MBL fold metallo-hydrolase [Roseiarcaceae bacterium H3SJ34-1]|uniref:MBL fold metallo-hydrolase n=1 Tax=Terripilifer ovatus TaxID=3032367 RepID=UPI003AB9AEE5|nr:MBL fold metallo-hydrolase [Roseiarcaceae bacterium H3SJ34-1]